MSLENKIRIVVSGSYTEGDGYPNVKWFLHAVANDSRFDIVTRVGAKREIKSASLYKLVSGSFIAKIVNFLLEIIRTVKSFAVVIFVLRRKDYDFLYIPYPALMSLLLYSLLPRTLRPFIIADTFISIYDTVVNDRKLLKKNSIPAKVLYAAEKISLETSDIALTDTECNSRFLRDIFFVDKEKFFSLPLFTDETNYFPYKRVAGHRIRVIFIATFVPLHGVDVVATAIVKLKNRDDIEFVVIGDGQTASQFQKILGVNIDRVRWERAWKNSSELNTEINQADICLGIFSATDKAKRVVPLKNYVSLMLGKPVITMKTDCWPTALDESKHPVAIQIDGDNPDQLVRQIEFLADNPEFRTSIGGSATDFYNDHLSNKVSLDAFYNMAKNLRFHKK